MISKYIAIAVAGVASFATISSRADISQTYNFSTNATFSGSGNKTFIPEGYFTASFLPYSGNPADLTGFQILWEITFNASGVALPGNTAGFGGGPGGPYSLDGVGYGGSEGSLSSSTGIPGGVIPPAISIVDSTNYFSVANAGVSYDPAILADVLSVNPVDLSWITDMTMSYGEIFSGQFSMTGSVTLTYNAVPEPGSMALAALGVSTFYWLRRRQA